MSDFSRRIGESTPITGKVARSFNLLITTHHLLSFFNNHTVARFVLMAFVLPTIRELPGATDRFNDIERDRLHRHRSERSFF